jgi:hypothetical protein
MKRHLPVGVLLCLAVIVPGAARAQYGQGMQPYGGQPGYNQNINPLLLRTPGMAANPWAQNFGAQNTYNNNAQIGMLQQQGMMNSAGVASQQNQLALLLPTTGHAPTFLNYRAYFLTYGRGGGAGGAGLGGAGLGGLGGAAGAVGGGGMRSTFGTGAQGMSGQGQGIGGGQGLGGLGTGLGGGGIR